MAKKKTGFKPVKQISDIREREAHINIDYYSNTCKLYTNHATTINRLAKKGIMPTNTTTVNGLAYGASYSVPLEDMKIFLQVGLYK